MWEECERHHNVKSIEPLMQKNQRPFVLLFSLYDHPFLTEMLK